MAISTARELQRKANRNAELFVEAYYRAYDSPERSNKLLQLYRSDAQIVWNGNPILGTDQFSAVLVAQLPFSRHEVLSFDAHVIPATPDRLPTLSITVTGQVLFSSQPFPRTFRIPEPKKISTDRDPTTAEIVLDDLPRVFSQSLILSPQGANQSASSYVITADCLRFVG